MLQTRVTELLGTKYPIVMGGLAYIGTAELAAAVSNAGGLGQVTAGTLRNADLLREQIRRTRELTDKPFGVNMALGHRPLDADVDVVIEEGVKVVSLSGGNPDPILKRLKPAGITVLVLVAGSKYARNAERIGADAVVALHAVLGPGVDDCSSGVDVVAADVVAGSRRRAIVGPQNIPHETYVVP